MTVRILEGDCREVLCTLPDESVHCIVTSPPYFGLRDYGTGTWIGGDAECAHDPTCGAQGNGQRADRTFTGSKPQRSVCSRCGAQRVDAQMGLENSPEEFIYGMVAVFRECRRVLRADGTLWLNIGDSYAGSGKGGNPDPGSSKQASNHGSQSVGCLYGTGKTAREAAVTNVTRKTFDGIKAKDLIGIPWMLAFALRADGWYLRQEIIWSKPNPMPESVTDRCTKAHESLFLLSKSQRYYFDAKAISEPITESTKARLGQPGLAEQVGSDRVPGKTNGAMKAVPPRFGGSKYGDDPNNLDYRSCGNEYTETDGSRNKRSVWTIATQPFNEAHFATFPPALVEPCILAGCPAGGVVLDPFGGAGTTGLVADRLQREAILIELNPEYAAIARRRILGDSPLFAEVA